MAVANTSFMSDVLDCVLCQMTRDGHAQLAHQLIHRLVIAMMSLVDHCIAMIRYDHCNAMIRLIIALQ